VPGEILLSGEKGAMEWHPLLSWQMFLEQMKPEEPSSCWRSGSWTLSLNLQKTCWPATQHNVR
jgi:hypothetical protein